MSFHVGLDRKIAEQALIKAARGPSQLRKERGDGIALSYDDFSDGSEHGWRDHFSGDDESTVGRPYPPLSLSRYPALDGYSLKCSTVDRPWAQLPGGPPKAFSAYKNMVTSWAPGEVDLLVLSGFFATMHHGSAPALGEWGLGFDHQLWDSSDRAFMKALCRYPGGAQSQWYLANNEGNPVALGKGDNLSAKSTMGINQNKPGWNFGEFAVKLSPNGEIGQYHSLQVNYNHFDLTDNVNVWTPGHAQTGKTTPQGTYPPGNSAQHFKDFGGGLNAGLFGGPWTGSTRSGALHAARLVITVYPSGS